MADEYEAWEDEFPLKLARGVVTGLVIGTVIWIVIVVLGVGLFSPSVLLTTCLAMLVVVVAPLLRRAARRTVVAESKIVGGRLQQVRQIDLQSRSSNRAARNRHR